VNRALGAVVGSRTRPLFGVWGEAPEADDIFVKICNFFTVLRMAYRYLHSLRTIQYEMEKK